MEVLSDYMTFGDRFKVFTSDTKYIFSSFKETKQLSDQAINSLNYLYPFIMKDNFNEVKHINILGLYSYIADRQYFEEDLFQGFISLEYYSDYNLYEYYYNKYDNITIYVYDEWSRDIKKKLNYINKNKCIFF